MGKPIDFASVAAAPWIGLPRFSAPVWNAQAIALIAPVAIVLVAENLGHVKAVAAMTGRNLDPYLGRAFLGDGIATIVAGAGGGTGVTTYAENIGVMAVTKIYSTLVFVVAALTAIVLGLLAEVRRADHDDSRPRARRARDRRVRPHHGDRSAHLGAEQRGLLANARNLVTAAATLTIGAGDLALKIGGFTLGGIGTATFGAIVLYQLWRDGAEEVTALRSRRCLWKHAGIACAVPRGARCRAVNPNGSL